MHWRRGAKSRSTIAVRGAACTGYQRKQAIMLGIRRPARWVCALTAAVLAIALAGVFDSSGRRAVATVSARPNIVFVMADDLSMNLLRFMPNVQRLAADGVSLARYYVVDSLCCPSRTSIMTGEYPHNTGVFTNVLPDGGYAAFVAKHDGNKTFAVALQKSGYRTALMGKFLNGYQQTNPAAPGWTQWVSTGNGYAEFNYTLNINGKYETHGNAPSDYLTDVLSNKAAAFIQSSVSAGAPFFLEVSTFAPHKPEVPAPRYATAYSTSVLPKTAAFNTLPTNPPSWMRAIPAMDSSDLRYAQGRWLARVRSVLAIDDLVGRLRTELTSLGVARNTYVIFTSDNGFHLGDHRLVYGKQTVFDTDVQVPLFVAGPGVPAAWTSHQMLSSIDLAPTFEHIAGVPVPATVDGVSMLRQWHGQIPTGWQQAILIEHHLSAGGVTDPDAQEIEPPSYEAVRTSTGLYAQYPPSNVAEFYNTSTDPWELHNVPAQAPVGIATQLHRLETCVGAVQCQAAAGAG